MKKSISIPNAPAPIGPYSQAIEKNNQLFISGQIPINPTTGELITDDIEKATHQVLQNINALVTTAGYKMEDIVKCSIFIKSMNDFQKINAVYATYFDAFPPARETVEVSVLPENARVEISCIAMK